MYCFKCGNKLNDGAGFCDHCGQKINNEAIISNDVIDKMICRSCGNVLEANEKFCDKCGKSVADNQYDNKIYDEHDEKEIQVMSKLPSFFKEKKNIIIVGCSVFAVLLIFLSGNIIPERNTSKTEMTTNNNETANAPITEESTTVVSETAAAPEETAYAVTVAPPPDDYKELDYEELYNNYIRELADYYGVASQNPFMQYPTSDIYNMHPIPSESFGLVSAYQSDINHDEVKDLVAISFINDDSDYIWRTQCFSINENKEIYQVSRYDYKIEKAFTYFKNHFMKAEIADECIIFSCSYCHHEGHTSEILILKLSDLSLNKEGVIKACSLGGTSIYIDGYQINYNTNYEGLSANDSMILQSDKVNSIALEKLLEVGLNCTKVSVCGESDRDAPTLLFNTSISLFDYSGSTSSKVYYPKEYTGLYSLLGITKGSKLLEPEAIVKNTAPNTRHYYYGSVDITSGVLNLRYRPNTDSEILAGIPKDTRLTLYLSGTDGWYYTNYMNNWGYVSADFIKLDSEITTAITKDIRPITEPPKVTKKTTTTVTTVTTPVATTIVITEPPEETQVVQPNEESSVSEAPEISSEPDIQDTEPSTVD